MKVTIFTKILLHSVYLSLTPKIAATFFVNYYYLYVKH